MTGGTLESLGGVCGFYFPVILHRDLGKQRGRDYKAPPTHYCRDDNERIKLCLAVVVEVKTSLKSVSQNNTSKHSVSNQFKYSFRPTCCCIKYKSIVGSFTKQNDIPEELTYNLKWEQRDCTLSLLPDEAFAEIARELQFSICRQDISLKRHNVWTELCLIHTEIWPKKSWPVLRCCDGTCQGSWTDICLQGREVTVLCFRAALVLSLTLSRRSLRRDHTALSSSLVSFASLLLLWRAMLNFDG